MKNIVAWCLVFLVIFVALRHLYPQGIVFYQGLVLSAAVAFSQWAWARRQQDHSEPGKDALLTFLLLYALVFTVPTTVDRAYSVRMILEIQKSQDGLTRAQIENWFATDFQSQGGVEKRLREQLATGSIEQDGERFRLTPLGLWLAGSFGVVQSIFATAAWKR